MKIKEHFKLYYRQLFDAIRYLDQDAINRSGESAIRLLNQNIDQLSAFISLLTHIDETIPLIRCQGALGKFKKDFIDLHLNYLEENLVEENPLLFDENKMIGKILSREESLTRDRYGKSVHDLYINTIHATEKIIMDHVDQVNEDKLRVKTFEYFTNLLSVYSEHLREGDFESLDLLLGEIYYNLLLFMEKEPVVSEDTIDEPGKDLLKTIYHLKEILTARKLYHDTARKLQFYGSMDSDLDKDLLDKIQSIENSLIKGGSQFEALGDQLTEYLNRKLWIKAEV